MSGVRDSSGNILLSEDIFYLHSWLITYQYSNFKIIFLYLILVFIMFSPQLLFWEFLKLQKTYKNSTMNIHLPIHRLFTVVNIFVTFVFPSIYIPHFKKKWDNIGLQHYITWLRDTESHILKYMLPLTSTSNTHNQEFSLCSPSFPSPLVSQFNSQVCRICFFLTLCFVSLHSICEWNYMICFFFFPYHLRVEDIPLYP